MSATVRCFSHVGVSMAFVANYSQQQSFNGLTQLKQPYIGRETLTADVAAVFSTPATLAPSNSRVLFVQVQSGKRVHYEISPPGRPSGPVAATTDSPILQGDEQFDWGSGWVISFLECTE